MCKKCKKKVIEHRDNCLLDHLKNCEVVVSELSSVDKGIAPETLEAEVVVVSDGSITCNIDDILR